MSQQHTCETCGAVLDAAARQCDQCGAVGPGGRAGGDEPYRKTGFSAPPRTLHPGDLLADRFRLVRVLGHGGMGVVWLAEDEQFARAPRAIKVLRADVSMESRGVRSLKQEVHIAQQLTHEHIVRIHDYYEDGAVHFITMEYVPGRSLAEALDAHREGLPLAEVMNWAEQAAVALDHAHDKGILHRDVKPGNFLLSEDGTLKLADFGVSRAVEDAKSRLTGQVASGTLLYMSPEQSLGRHLDTRCDVYSFAASLYELLAGQPPFHTGNITLQIEKVMPARIAGIPAHVNAALLRGLAKDPKKRPQGCGDLVAELNGTSGRPQNRLGGWAAAAVLVAISAVALGVYSANQGEDAPTVPLEVAESPPVAKPDAGVDFSEESSMDAALPAHPDQVDKVANSLARAREEATALRDAVRTDTVRRYADGTLAEADAHYAKAEETPDASPDEAAEHYAMAARAYEQAQAEARTKLSAARDKAAEARERAAEAKAALTTDSRTHAGEEVSRGDAAWADATVSGLDYAAAAEHYATAETAYEKAVRIAPERKSEASTPTPGDPYTVYLGDGVTLDLVWIPPGEFVMGSSDGGIGEKPEHGVRITRGFWMGKYEVTNAQYQRYIPSHGSVSSDDELFYAEDKPAVRVSWDNAHSYLNWLSNRTGYAFRLPTEAEWEYACRAGTSTPFHWGSTLSCDKGMFENETAPYNGDCVEYYESMALPSGTTAPVGTFSPNSWGLYDMHGNVHEWCEDWYLPSVYDRGPSVDPTPPFKGQYRVLRGGSWETRGWHCTSFSRHMDYARHSDLAYGFRPVMTTRDKP